MTLRQTLAVALLTALYLCIELAFNARLLDIVGAAADADQVHAIEVWGRSLSGAAAALFLLQGLLVLRNKVRRPVPWGIVIPVACGALGYGVFLSLQALVDHLVAQSAPEFRRASGSIVLVQQALVDGSWRVDGLGDDPAVFSRPEGKAFLAQFPLIAASVERLDDKIGAAKASWIARAASDRAGGPDAAYGKYVDAVYAAHGQWRKYRQASQPASEHDIARQQEKAWNDYVQRLRKRGVTPYTVPDAQRDKVLREVRQQVPVPPDWDLADEDGFKRAVADRIQARASTAASVPYHGKRIPAGLSWEAFLAHPVVQEQLRQTLKLTVAVRIEPRYRSRAEFEQKVFQPQIRAEVLRRTRALEQPPAAYADTGALAQDGREAARAAIVPPLALFCSMLGALAHLAKLLLLLLRLAALAVPAWRGLAGYAWLPPAGVFLAAWLLAANVDNAVTQSRVYRYLQAQVREDGEPVRARLLAHGLHLVTVGQGHAYPLNDLVRRELLGGFSFGSPPAPTPRSAP